MCAAVRSPAAAHESREQSPCQSESGNSPHKVALRTFGFSKMRRLDDSYLHNSVGSYIRLHRSEVIEVGSSALLKFDPRIRPTYNYRRLRQAPLRPQNVVGVARKPGRRRSNGYEAKLDANPTEGAGGTEHNVQRPRMWLDVSKTEQAENSES